MKTNSKKSFNWTVGIILFVSIGLFTAGLLIFTQSKIQAVESVTVKSAVVESVVAAGTGSSIEIPGQPAQLVIPSIGVNAAVEGVGLSKTASGEMAVPTKLMDVAWYNQGPLPGMLGSAVIAGHLNGRTISAGVFYKLNKLKIGDLVEIIDQKGKEFQFKVVDVKIFDYNASAKDVFLSDNSKARLNLITCSGDWIKDKKIYNKRTVIFTELVTQ